MPRRTILLLSLLALVTVAIVAYDVLRTDDPDVPPTPSEAAERESAPEELPTVTRALSRAALVYPGEFAHELVTRLRGALAAAEPSGSLAPAEPAVLLSARLALIPAGAAADRWRLRTGERAIPARLAGIDAVHGVALLRLDEDAPSGGLAIQESSPAAPQPLVALRAQPGQPAMQYFAASSLPLRARLSSASVAPGDPIVDLEGRLAGFVGRTSRGAVALDATLVRSITQALDRAGRHPHPWLGADLQTITPPLRTRFAEGALVAVFVWPGSQAAEAGLSPGQTFAAVHAGGTRFVAAEALMDALQPGDTLRLEAASGKGAVELIVGDLQSAPHEAADPRGLWPDTDSGVPIVVAPGSAAASAGLATGDRIEAIDLRPARLPSMQQILRRGTAALLTVERDYRRRFVWLPARSEAAGASEARAGVR